MRRSLMIMRLIHQQQDPSSIKKWVPMNVITLVSPNPMISQQMIQELQKWTKPLTQNVVEQTTNETTSDIDRLTSKKKQMVDFLHFNPSDHNDALNDWVRTKSNYSIFQNLLQQQQHSHDSDGADSVVLCVGGDDALHTTNSSNTETFDHTTIPTTWLHFVSSSTPSNSLFSLNNDKNKSNVMSLLAIQSMYVSMDDTVRDQKQMLVQEIRNQLAQLLIDKEQAHRNYSENQRLSLSWMEKIKMSIQQYIRRQQQQHYHRKDTKTNSMFTSLLRTNDFVPLFDVTTAPPNANVSDYVYGHDILPKWNIGDLKEIVIPFDFSYTMYGSSTTTLIDTLSSILQHEFNRPVTGLYQLPYSNVYIRPIPMAKEDRQCCTLPTLIFHSDTEHMDGVLQKNHKIDMKNEGTTKLMKIGYTGRTSHGQLMISDISRFGGIAVRLCAQQQPTSAFAEAQDSLLASSLKELQSQHVLLSKSDHSKDPRINNTDCWVEFRANLRHPLGFIPSSSSSLLSGNLSNPPKIAKAPDLPYE